jgi:hypothetical protein
MTITTHDTYAKSNLLKKYEPFGGVFLRQFVSTILGQKLLGSDCGETVGVHETVIGLKTSTVAMLNIYL